MSKDSFRTSQDSNNDMSIGDFEIDNRWDDMDPGILTRDNDWTKPKFFDTGNTVYQHNPYNLRVTCKIGKNLRVVEKGITEVLFGKPFKDNTGLEEDLKGGEARFLKRRLMGIHPMSPSYKVGTLYKPSEGIGVELPL
ncbi:hypothetical protein Tco_0465099 [Tanacetum coccineum]